jgi:hypothetical protein
VASGPRNQRYLHPRFIGTGVFVCKVDEGCKFAKQFDSEGAIVGHKPNLFNELTYHFSGFHTGALLIEGFPQIGDLPAVHLSKIRVQTDNGCRCALQLSQEIGSPGVQGRHLIL